VTASPVPERRSFLSDLAEGWRAVRARRWLWASLLGFGIGNLAWGAQGVLGPIVARDDLGGASAWGAIATAGGIGGALGGIVALRWRPERPLVASHLIIVVLGVYLLLYTPPATTVVIAAGALASVFTIVLANTLWETVLQSHVPQDVISRVSSYDWAVSLVFMPIGFAVWGPLSEWIGMNAAFTSAAAVAILTRLLVIAVPDVRNLRRADSQASLPAAEAPT
jgi:hypothetical protein